MMGAIILEEYNPRWPEQFEQVRSRVASALGPLASAIEHIGSTSVPGLAAKPIIDLDVLLKEDADLPSVIAKLKALGYRHEGDLGIPSREAFVAPYHDSPHHLYVCLPGGEEYSRHVRFRDHLRTHPQDAEAYSTLKRALARQFTADRDAYTKAKTEFITGILRQT